MFFHMNIFGLDHPGKYGVANFNPVKLATIVCHQASLDTEVPMQAVEHVQICKTSMTNYTHFGENIDESPKFMN